MGSEVINYIWCSEARDEIDFFSFTEGFPDQKDQDLDESV